jgi:hypothetical protein
VGAPGSQIEYLPPEYVYSHALLPGAEFFNLDAFAQDSQYNIYCNPDMLTNEGTSTG